VFFCKSYENTSDENKKAPTSVRTFVVPMGQLSSFDTEDLLKIFEFLEVLNLGDRIAKKGLKTRNLVF